MKPTTQLTSRRSRKLLYCLVALAASVVVPISVIVSNGYLRTGPKRLMSAWEAVREIASFNHGQLPSSLSTVLSESGVPDSVFQHGTRGGTELNIQYIDWSKEFNLSEIGKVKVPVIVESSDRLHWTRGRYILFSDGTLMWDAGSKWWTGYIAEHPVRVGR